MTSRTDGNDWAIGADRVEDARAIERE